MRTGSSFVGWRCEVVESFPGDVGLLCSLGELHRTMQQNPTKTKI